LLPAWVASSLLCDSLVETASILKYIRKLPTHEKNNGLVFKKLAGESADVSVKSTDAWLEILPSLLEGYEPCDVYNADEMGLFFNVLPDRTLAYKGETCHRGKHSKDRLNVLLCVNSDGSD
jgi:hypothetical protein